MKTRLRNYLQSRSTLFGYGIGVLMYLTYASAHGAWANPALIAVTAFVGGFIPFYSRFSNQIEERVQFRTAWVTPGRAARFLAQFLFNEAVFEIFALGGVVPSDKLRYVGGTFTIALVTTLASQGIQYVALSLSNREIGEKNRNVLLGLSANVIVTALATLGLEWTRTLFYGLGYGFGALFFGIGVLSDLRAARAPKGGIGVFFGTFNPFHNTHLSIIRRAMEERGLSRVYVHSTVVPKLHAESLRRGEIVIARREAGMRVYERTPKADVHMNYFPTGNRFYEFGTRKRMMELAIEEAGLQDRVKVLSMPETYARRGFYGVVDAIRAMHPGARIHGIHGSDLGGMWIRSIYDESGWIYPYPVRRIDAVSATAIRKGSTGMAPRVIEEILGNLREERTEFQVRGLKFQVKEGQLIEGEMNHVAL